MSAAVDIDSVRRRLLEAALVHVPFDGWSARALAAGARDAGIDDATARRAFPRGAGDALAWWSDENDRRMLEALAELDLDAMKIRQRIAAAVRIRLDLDGDHREALRLALGHAAMPAGAPGGLRALYRTVDAVWRAAGDTATDYNFYTKRGLLAGVYVSTLLYWLNDRSEGSSASWAFLDRRIDDVMKVPRVLEGLKGCLPNPERLLRARRRRRAARG